MSFQPAAPIWSSAISGRAASGTLGAARDVSAAGSRRAVPRIPCPLTAADAGASERRHLVDYALAEIDDCPGFRNVLSHVAGR
jgi:hypothetical protein